MSKGEQDSKEAATKYYGGWGEVEGTKTLKHPSELPKRDSTKDRMLDYVTYRFFCLFVCL